MAVERSTFITGLLGGFIGAMVIPIILPFARRGARPIAKSAIKGTVNLAQKGREVAAEWGEKMEDLVAEAKSEMAPQPSTPSEPNAHPLREVPPATGEQP